MATVQENRAIAERARRRVLENDPSDVDDDIAVGGRPRGGGGRAPRGSAFNPAEEQRFGSQMDLGMALFEAGVPVSALREGGQALSEEGRDRAVTIANELAGAARHAPETRVDRELSRQLETGEIDLGGLVGAAQRDDREEQATIEREQTSGSAQDLLGNMRAEADLRDTEFGRMIDDALPDFGTDIGKIDGISGEVTPAEPSKAGTQATLGGDDDETLGTGTQTGRGPGTTLGGPPLSREDVQLADIFSRFAEEEALFTSDDPNVAFLDVDAQGVAQGIGIDNTGGGAGLGGLGGLGFGDPSGGFDIGGDFDPETDIGIDQDSPGIGFDPSIGNFAEGGMVEGRPGRDNVNAKLTAGEFVVNKEATSKNRALLEAINAGGQFLREDTMSSGQAEARIAKLQKDSGFRKRLMGGGKKEAAEIEKLRRIKTR